MEPRVPEFKEVLQNAPLQLNKSKPPRKLLNTPKLQNIKLSTLAYAKSVMTHVNKSVGVKTTLERLFYYKTQGEMKGRYYIRHF